MKFSYDKEADAAYVYFVDSIGDGEAVETIELNDNIVLDFDKDGKLLGMEILSAGKVLGEKVLLANVVV